MGYMLMPTREHKLASRGEKRTMLGITHNLTNGIVSVRSEKTGKIVHRQNVLWYPETPQPQSGSGPAVASGGEGK